jgi:ribulose-bisphosphate carboxylase large chain
LKNVRLQNVVFPEGMVKAHRGPRFGKEDARKILGVFGRPLVGTIVKPKVDLDPAGTSAAAAAAVRGGLDLAKDDATLSDQSFCRMIYRVEAVMSALEKVEKETDKQAFYAVNVAAGADRIVDRAEKAIEHSANMVMVDVLTAGFSALVVLSRNVNATVHVHAPCTEPCQRQAHGISI